MEMERRFSQNQFIRVRQHSTARRGRGQQPRVQITQLWIALLREKSINRGIKNEPYARVVTLQDHGDWHIR